MSIIETLSALAAVVFVVIAVSILIAILLNWREIRATNKEIEATRKSMSKKFNGKDR